MASSGRALFLVGTNLLLRGAELLTPGRKTAAGNPTHVLYGVTRALLQGIAFKEPTLAAAVLEATPELPKDLASQHEALERLFDVHGVPVLRSETPEALVASLTAASLEAGYDVVVVGSDKRLAQLVSDNVWWYDAFKDVRYTPELVRKRFDVSPERVSDWLALVGDDQTLPGVKGIGKKGATTLLETYGSIGAALESADEVEGRTGKALCAAADEAERESQRARLTRDVRLPAALEDLQWSGVSEQAQDLYLELGFLELLDADGGTGLEVQVGDSATKLKDALDALEETMVAIMLVTEDPSPLSGDLVGVALVQGDRVVYAPVASEGPIPGELQALLEDPARPKLSHDTTHITSALERRSVALRGVCGDSAWASHLHQPSNLAPHNLEVIAPKVLRRTLPREDEIRGVGKRRKRWQDLKPEKVGRYFGALAKASMDIWDSLGGNIDARLLQEYRQLSETLSRMEVFGIAVNEEDLERSGEDFDRIGEKLEAEIHDLAGKEFNIGSTKQLGSVLFEDLGLPVYKKTKTGWSVATEALERIEGAHPIVPLVIRHRLLRRLKDMWVKAFRETIQPDGRVRALMFPARSFSGRVICATPDLGRVPGKTPEMARIRHAFQAPEGRLLLSVDYKQLGLYVLAHLTKDPALVAPLREGADLHTLTAAAVLERPESEIRRPDRQIGKVVNFATFAGQGASSLALQLGVSAKKAKEYIARFDKRYATVRAFQDEQLRLAQERGYIETLAGRRWPISDLGSPDVIIRSYAERLARRATHEASVADVSRKALWGSDQALREAGLKAQPVLQVLDEVLFEVPEDELEETVEVASDAMRDAYDLEVPLRVGAKAGPNWAELEPL